jgi:secondary thiamine-phosphate synthase enzyme
MMAIITKKIKLSTEGKTDIIDITSEVSSKLGECQLKNGVVVVFIPGATGAITVLEYEPGLVKDLKEALEKIAPQDGVYAHNKKWGDMNGYSHIRASILGPSLSVPFVNGNLQLGRWQQIIFIELDNRPRSREIILQIMGE